MDNSHKTINSLAWTDGQIKGQMDKETNGLMDKNYIPLWHTSYAGGITRAPQVEASYAGGN